MFKCGLLRNPKNRFFDKSYQLIVTKNGNLTINTEVPKIEFWFSYFTCLFFFLKHAAFDGMISVNLSNYVQEKIIRSGMNDINKVIQHWVKGIKFYLPKCWFKL